MAGLLRVGRTALATVVVSGVSPVGSRMAATEQQGGDPFEERRHGDHGADLPLVASPGECLQPLVRIFGAKGLDLKASRAAIMLGLDEVVLERIVLRSSHALRDLLRPQGRVALDPVRVERSEDR